MRNNQLSKIKEILAEVFFKEFQPYSFGSKRAKDYQSVSNFFPFISNNSLKTRYVFDNAPVLFERFKNNSIKHLITIYDHTGSVIASREVSCDLPLFNVNITDMLPSNSTEYGSFTHHIKYTKAINDHITFHLRGYTYYSSVSSNLETMCHGNFGGIALNREHKLIFLAKQRSIFTYTTQLILTSSKRYSFYWNNPTNSPLDVKMFSCDFGELAKHTVPPMGTAVFALDSYNGLVHFQSRLPIGRPVILICDQTGFIDALHG